MAGSDDSCAIISRKEALAARLTHFFTGVPCRAGHVDRRVASSGTCVTCNRELARASRKSNPELIARLEKARRSAPADPGRPVIHRAEALLRGLPRYFTGIPCINGHLSERNTKRKLCLACHRERRAIIRATMPETVKAQKAASYLRHAEAVKAKVQAYVEANGETVRLRRQRHRVANKDRLAADNAEWRAKNRHISRQHERNRRARERGAEGTHTAADIARIRQQQRDRCANPACRKPLRGAFHVDHIQPIALGGTNWPRNLQMLCAPCNQAKNARDPIAWAQSNGLLL